MSTYSTNCTVDGTYLQLGSTIIDSNTAASGTLSQWGFMTLDQPTLSATNTSVTTTNAATLYIQGPPIAGTNETLTNTYALQVGSGKTSLGGNLFVNGNISASGTLPTINVGTVDGGTLADTAQTLGTPWGFSPTWSAGASGININKNSISDGKSALQISANWNITSNISPDFTGAPGGSFPLVYAEIEVSGGSNIQPHALSGYIVNNGCQDANAVSGRVSRLQCTLPSTGTQECCGVWGSAYNTSSNAGFTAAAEFDIYNNITGSVASDTISLTAPNGIVCALHVASISTGSPANALVYFDSNTSSGFYGAWNTILIDSSCFPGAGSSGTVAINGGSWNSGSNGKYPESAIKFGDATMHFNCDGGTANTLNINARGGVKIYGGPPSSLATAAGIQLYPSTGQNAYIDFNQGTTFATNLGLFNNFGGVTGKTLFGVADGGTYSTSINRSGGQVFIGNSFNNSYGFTFGASNAYDGYATIYRQSSTAGYGVLDIYSDVGSTRANVFRISSDGNVMNVNNSYGALSDVRLKENISSVSNMLDRLLQVQVKRFSMKQHKKSTPDQMGVIAQELEDIFPELVTETSDGYKAVAYSQFIPIIIQSLQELYSLIDQSRTSNSST